MRMPCVLRGIRINFFQNIDRKLPHFVNILLFSMIYLCTNLVLSMVEIRYMFNRSVFACVCLARVLNFAFLNQISRIKSEENKPERLNDKCMIT